MIRIFGLRVSRRRRAVRSAAPVCAVLAAALCPAPAPAQVTPAKWQAVAHALGAPGEIRGDAFRIAFAPSVARLLVRGARLGPGSLAPSWVTFTRQGDLGWMFGRLLLPAARAATVTGKLATAGIDVVAAIDPFPGSSPAIVTLYFREVGDPVRMAAALHKALGATLRAPAASIRAEAGNLDSAAIEAVLERPGRPESGALVFRIARAEKVKCCGLPNDPLLVFSGFALGPAAGLESRIAFEGDRLRAVVSGRLLVRREEIGPVERALAFFGIQTVSLAEVFPDEEPRIFSLYLLGQGKPLEVAQGLRAAIERTRQAPSAPLPSGAHP